MGMPKVDMLAEMITMRLENVLFQMLGEETSLLLKISSHVVLL